MAILRGNTVLGGSGTASINQMEHEYDTVVTSTLFSDKNSWSVLNTAKQVLPLVLIPKDFVQKEENHSKLYKVHTGLQKIVDDFFNHGVPALARESLEQFSETMQKVTKDLPLLEAQEFVHRFNEYFQQVITPETSEIDSVREFNSMFMATRFVETYRQFRDSGKPTQVMLAYHYTDSANLDSIERNGLMSGPERTQAGILCKKYSGERYENSARAELCPVLCLSFSLSHIFFVF
jgi:hypothetical protein